MVRWIFLLTIGLFLAACSNRMLPPGGDVIALGVIRSSFNIRDVYAIDTKGSGSVQWILPSHLGSNPDWSSDGNWILSSTEYQVRHPSDSEIFLMAADGSKRITLPHHSGGSFHPVWSPDGSQMAYSARDSQAGIYVLNMECFKQFLQTCTDQPAFIVDADYSAPDWSPDSEKLVYDVNGGIFVTNIHGDRKPSKLISTLTNCYNPTWQPNGTKIAVSCYVSDQFDIFVVNEDGSDLINLTESLASDTQPQWSSDGRKIFFISDHDGLGQIIGTQDTVRSSAIFSMNNDGSNVIRLSLRNDEHVLWFTYLKMN